MSITTFKNDDNFNPTSLDVILAITATFIFPFLAYWLFTVSGALIPLILYYGLFCFIIVKWRRKTLQYFYPFNINYAYFAFFLFFEYIIVLVSTQTFKFTNEFNLIGFLLTLIIWVPLNGLSEQLAWIYIYDTIDKYISYHYDQKIGKGAGLLFYFTFIGLIHIFFWGNFLFESETLKLFPWTPILITAQFVIAIGYLITYKQSKSMWPVFILHVLTDLSGVILTGYSILPSLLNIRL